jgi:hypothetical protein
MPQGGVTADVGPGLLLGGRYRLQRLLGTGGMASVWLGRDQRLGRTVAVKVLSEVLALDDSYVRRFGREARIAARLSHPGLVRVYDFSAEAERPYLVMDHVEGGTLADRTAGSVDAEALATELLDALAHIHSAGVIHRDIKPANVLIDDEGRVRLTDFGIAWPEDATQITRTGEVIGTLKYMAPEAREGEPATEQADLYSCGVVLSEQLGRSSRPELAGLVERLTEPDPARRPASASDALRMLGEDGGTAVTEVLATKALATDPATERTPPTGATAPDPRRKRELAVGVVTALTVIAGLGAIVVLLLLLLGGGDDSGGQNASGSAPAPEVRTTTTTSTAPAPPAVTTTVPAAPAPEAKPPKEEKPPKGFGPSETGPPGLEGKEFGEQGGPGPD